MKEFIFEIIVGLCFMVPVVIEGTLLGLGYPYDIANFYCGISILVSYIIFKIVSKIDTKKDRKH